MTFIEHLEQLRWALIRIILNTLFFMCFGFFYSELIQSFLMKPISSLELENFKLQDIKITSPFMAKIVIALLIGFSK